MNLKEGIIKALDLPTLFNWWIQNLTFFFFNLNITEKYLLKEDNKSYHLDWSGVWSNSIGKYLTTQIINVREALKVCKDFQYYKSFWLFSLWCNIGEKNPSVMRYKRKNLAYTIAESHDDSGQRHIFHQIFF